MNSSNTVTTGDERIRLQALSLINDCYKYIMDLTTNGVVITDAINFVQTNKERLMPKEDNGKEFKEPDSNEDKDHLEEEQEEETGNIAQRKTANQVF
ncbi:MAG TPA: hypothetical protein VFR94_23465 [Nitrososphaeraceae archaeon]|nr:hypothetical protein [Nitrososphaeraceae archaeon]